MWRFSAVALSGVTAFYFISLRLVTWVSKKRQVRLCLPSIYGYDGGQSLVSLVSFLEFREAINQ